MTRASTRSARPAGRALDVTVVLAVLLPLLTAGAVLLTRTESPAVPERAPAETALGAASVICPSPRTGRSPVLVATGSEASGSVTVGADAVRVTDGALTSVRSGDGPVVVDAEDRLAPGLVAGRFAERPLGVAECRAPDPEQWFTGVGASARHASVLELVNPDNGPAVADVVVTGRAGVVDVPGLRGVSVPGNGSVRFDLARVVPRRDELSLRVTTARGRLHAAVLDSVDELGAGASAQDWLPAQDEPGTDLTLLGLPSGPGPRTLLVANDGDSEVRATVRVVNERSVFAPEGVSEIRVAPQSVRRVQLGRALAPLGRDGAVGLSVTATGPVTATLRSFVGGDLAHAVAAAPVSTSTVAVLPPGRKRLLLAGAGSTGVVTVVARDATGEELARERVEVAPDRGFATRLPTRAVHLTVTPERTPVLGAVLATPAGAGVVRLRELVRSGLVPAVRPGLP